ncbi:MAG TPA: ComEC family competence protein [Anaerolineae bacterium]|nr:ComEC family competence protein [Anaerolineae bacterium]
MSMSSFRQTYRPPTPYLPVYAALGLAAGVVAGYEWVARGGFGCAGERLSPDPRWLLLPVLVLAPMLWWGRHRRRVLIPTVVVLFLLLGAWRYLSHPFEPCFPPDALVHHHAADPYGRPRVMEGVIVSYPVVRESGAQYVVRMDAIWDGEEKLPVSGRALVRTDQVGFQYGDRVKVRGVPMAPPTFPGFDYRRYLARRGVHTLVRRAELHLLARDQGNPLLAALYAVRARASALLDQLMPQPYAALANGMILGIESGIPRDLYEQFNLTGTSHVIVISGSNIALVSAILLLLFSAIARGRKPLAAIFTLAGIGLYVLLVGADAAVMRAGIMGGLYVIATALNRQSAAIISLFIAGLAMLLINPLTLWDVGFQLSFMATLGLILFSQPLQARWDRWAGQRLPRLANNLLAEGLLITLAAQITTMPLVVHYFGRLSIISFLANLLIIPVQPPILIAGGLAIPLAAVFFPLGQLIALIPWASLWWTVFVVERMAAIPWGSVEVGAFGRLLAAWYYILFLVGFLWWLFRQEQGARALIPPRYRPALVRAAMAAGVILGFLWVGATAWAARPDGRLHVRLLGLGERAVWHLTTPSGRRVLLVDDAVGEAPLAAILRTLPGGGSVDLLILENRAEMPEVRARAVFTPETPLGPGTVIRLEKDVSLVLLDAPPAEPRLYRLRFGQFTTLLPLTNSQATQARWLARGLLTPVTLLVTPWPGTGAWPHPDLLVALQPQTILQPQGTTYPPGVQRRFETYPGLVRIPNDAMVEIITDGQRVELRQQPYPPDMALTQR